MEFPEHIEVRKDVMLGKSCIKGTRIPVYLILEKLTAGETNQDILGGVSTASRRAYQGLS